MKIAFDKAYVEAIRRGAKTQTRRNWDIASYNYQAADRHFHCGRAIKVPWVDELWSERVFGLVRLTEKPRIEKLADISEADFEAEGGRWLFPGGREEFLALPYWARNKTGQVAVLKFEYRAG